MICLKCYNVTFWIVEPIDTLRNYLGPEEQAKPHVCDMDHVRFGSKADMCSATRHVRFVPIADIASLHSITSSAREKMLNIPEDAHFNNMSTFATDEHLRQDDDLDIPV